MNSVSYQTTFPLKVSSPYSYRYFVPHSGVAEAYHHLQGLLKSVYLGGSNAFSMTYIHGPAASGKQHLREGFREQLLELGVDPARYCLAGLPESEAGEAEFVANYERIRTVGGLVLVTGLQSPESVPLSPHTRSRLLAGSVFRVAMPHDSELRPVVQSLLERHNLRLSDYSVDFLIRRLPRDLLSFDQIFDKIDELSLPNRRPATLGTVRQALEEGLKS